jgi:HK97 family phage major capsid protein
MPPELTEEQKKELIASTAAEVKAAIKEETKDEITKLNKLIADKFEELKKGNITEAEFKAYTEKVDKRIDDVETALSRPGMGDDNKGDEEPSEEMKAFESWMRKGTITPEEQKVMRISDDVAGGYTAPIELRNRIITKLTEISPIRQIVSVETIGGSGVEFPKEGEDTVTAAWPDEELIAGDFKWEMEKLDPKELRALVTPKKTLLEDSVFNLEEYIIRKTSEKFNKKEGTAFISGPGTSARPEGLLTNSDVAEVKSGNASALTADGILKLKYDLPDYYASNAKFLMKRSTVLDIRLFKDQNDQYIWQPNYQAGQPSTLVGDPIVEAIDMPAVASDSYPILYGDFKAAYLIIDRENIDVQRLIEKYALEGMIGFLFWKRTDAQVILAEAIRKQKVAA